MTSSADEDEDISIPVETGRTAITYTRPCEFSTTSGAGKNIQRGLPTRSRQNRSDSVQKSTTTVTTISSKKPSSNRFHENLKVKSAAGAASRPISAFFGSKSVSQRDDDVQQFTQKPKDATARQVRQEQEDVIEDESCAEQTDSQSTAKCILDRRKQNRSSTGAGKKPVTVNQRFKISPDQSHQDSSERKGLIHKKVDGRPWAERYGPLTLEELAVNKKKVASVKDWLDKVWYGDESQRLLILRGPSGAGKTATMGALARNMNFELSEWRNPVGSDVSSESYSSMSAQFNDFLGRSGRFGRLDLAGETTVNTIEQSFHHNSYRHLSRKRVVLLEEFPNISLVTSSILRSFRSSIMEFLIANTPSSAPYLFGAKESSHSVIPLIMIITETRSNSSTTAGEAFTTHKLLGPEVLNHPGVGVIEFNSVATTFLTKALDLVLQKEARDSGRRSIPNTYMLKKLGEFGDIRSAIGSLEFLCAPSRNEDDWGGRVPMRGRKGVQSSTTLTSMEKESLELVTQREASVGLFHAVGKVVYNKRDGVKAGIDTDRSVTQPPDHLSEHVRSRPSLVNVDELNDETGCDTSTFIAALHENYVISCEGASFISSLNGSIESLSDADVLTSSAGSKFGVGRGGYSEGIFQGAAAENLRAHDISFQLVVRGLLFSLPDPVKRTSHTIGITGRSGGKADAYKMYYPTSARIHGQMEEIRDSLDRWAIRLQDVQSITGTKASTVSNRLLRNGEGTALVSRNKEFQAKENDQNESFRSNIGVTRIELMAERLPYLHRIGSRNLSPGLLREIESITQFCGIYLPSEGPAGDELDEDIDADVPVAELATTISGNASSRLITPRNGLAPLRDGRGKEESHNATPGEEKLEKLYLTDDDIEDAEL